MASYQSGFDPPTRPGDTTRSKRLGAYMPPGNPQLEGRSDDVALSPGKKEHRRPPATHATRSHQTALPKLGTRVPSPIVRPIQETKTTGSRFGFGRSRATSPAPSAPPAPPAPPASVPELKGKPSRNVLRRKPSSIAPNSGVPRAPAVRTDSSSPPKWPESLSEKYQSIESSMKSGDAHNEKYTRTAIIRPSAQPRVIPELDRYHNRQEQNAIPSRPHAEVPHKIATQDLPQPSQYSATPLHSGLSNHPNRLSGYSGSGYSASPSTRFSESPGPGAYSRDTTPTSMSSQSPGIVAPVKTHTPRLRQGSPATTRPPVTRRRTGSTSEADEPTVDDQGLPALRESLNSSSSNSTVKDGDRSKVKKKAKRLSPLPPSPPPRKSSKFTTPPREQELPARLPTASIKQVSTSSDGSPKPRKVVPQAQSSTTPPMRPSREGAPDLNSQLGKSITVIQSNLASVKPSQDRRRSSLPRGVFPSPLQGQLMSPPSASSRGPSPAPVQTSYREAMPAPRGLGIVPDLKPQQITTNPRGTGTRTPSPSVANPKSRFGLFSRRTKTAPEVARAENKEKSSRKGPAAGTGHEGYGRYAMRGRSTSAGATNRSRDRSLSAGTSASQDSFASTRAFDPFLLERMSPVVIAGGGEIIQNGNASSEISRSESNTSLLLERPSMESKGSSSQVSSKSSLSNEVSRTTLWPSAIPKDAPRRVSGITPKGRRPSDSSDDAVSKPSLAFRRSIQRLNNSAGSLPLKLPKPLNIPGIGISSSMSSLDTSVMSEESQLDRKAELQRGRQHSAPKKLSKRPKSPEKPKKWNFFHRSDKSSESQAREPAAMKVVVNNAPPRPMPHYAMMDSSDEQQDTEGIDIEDILRDAEVVDLTNEELDELQFKNYTANLKRMDEVKIEGPPEFAHLATVPIVYSAPQPLPITADVPQPEFKITKENAPVRPSRLPQVGRIPNVVRARPEQTSPKSFSRPFARVSMLQPLNDAPVFDKESVGLGPSPEKPSTPEPSNTNEDKEPKNRHGSGESSSSHSDFLAFSLRKNSGTTTSSSGVISYTGITAVIPEVDAELEEDEVWDEYDDLIERDDTPKVPPSATSSHGVPFQYENYESRAIKQTQEKQKESPTLTAKKVIKDDSPPRKSNTSSSVYSQEMNARLKEALTTVPSPTTPMSFTDFFSGYGDRNNSVGGDSDKKPRPGSHSSAFSRKSQSTTGNSRASTDSRLITILEQEQNSPIQQVNLRVGSMTVSKWLTFGHVLFSPAREELLQLDGAAKHHSILVIDGLGNDDWSFYAAETYPNATFYNLSPTRPLPTTSQLSPSSGASFPLTPDNHRQVQYTSHLDKFPFPRDFFSTVVYRFPTACSEAAYRNIIAESKRVLKPAGYLEISMLDLDMMNMGNRARRAVRGLKVKMQVADRNTSLASASDTVLRAIGKRGFHDIKSCKVGVPVASIISPTTSTATSTSMSKPAQPKEELSLADMMKDESEAGDEGITKMVAKVGRWWFTRCYEMGVMPDGDVSRSIFNDEMLLRECEKWSTNFKLVVAYAQKPIVPRRRTASV